MPMATPSAPADAGTRRTHRKYVGVGVPSADCTNAVAPFTQERIDQLYSGHADYVTKYTKATLDLVKGGYIGQDDANRLIAAAQARDIP